MDIPSKNLGPQGLNPTASVFVPDVKAEKPANTSSAAPKSSSSSNDAVKRAIPDFHELSRTELTSSPRVTTSDLSYGEAETEAPGKIIEFRPVRDIDVKDMIPYSTARPRSNSSSHLRMRTTVETRCRYSSFSSNTREYPTRASAKLCEVKLEHYLDLRDKQRDQESSPARNWWEYREKDLISYYFMRHAHHVAEQCKQKCSSLTEGHILPGRSGETRCRCQSLSDAVSSRAERLYTESLPKDDVKKLSSMFHSAWMDMLEEFDNEPGDRSPVVEFSLSYPGIKLLEAYSSGAYHADQFRYVGWPAAQYGDDWKAVLDRANEEIQSNHDRFWEHMKQGREICYALERRERKVNPRAQLELPAGLKFCKFHWGIERYCEEKMKKPTKKERQQLRWEEKLKSMETKGESEEARALDRP